MAFVFDAGLGLLARYASHPAANDALILVPLQTTGLEADSVLRTKATLAAVVSGSTDEQTTVGRKTLVNLVRTVDTVNHRAEYKSDDVVWSGGAVSGNDISAFVLCYDPDTTTGTDADLVPILKFDVSWHPSDGQPFTLGMNPFYRANSAT
jgi:hypothetical protein